MTRADFRELARRAAAAPGYGDLQRIVEKEILHNDILHALTRAGLLDGLVFHGGTALRLCHGGQRLSEGLDFCTGAGFTAEQASAIAGKVQQDIAERYGLQVRVAEPKARDDRHVHIRRWWVRVETEPGYSDRPWQRIKIEIANVPSHANEPRTLIRNHDVIPDGYEDIVVRVETREGIMADKFVALPATLPTYARWRDIWDIRWLRKQGVAIDAALVHAKVEDCRIDGFGRNLAAAIEQLPGLVRSGGLATALGEFLPPDVAERTVWNSVWLDAVAIELQEMLDDLQGQLGL